MHRLRCTLGSIGDWGGVMRSTRVLGAMFAALLLLLTSVPAQAQSRIREDTRADVAAQTCDYSGPRPACSWRAAPRRANGDIIRNTVNHTASRVIVRTKFRMLRKIHGDLHYVVRVRSSDGQWRDIIGGWNDVGGGGGAFMVHPDGDESYCADLTQRIDWEHDYIELAMPRSCVRNPAWVRVGARMAVTDYPPGLPYTWPDDLVLPSYVDQAYLSVPMTDMSWRLSGRAYRG